MSTNSNKENKNTLEKTLNKIGKMALKSILEFDISTGKLSITDDNISTYLADLKKRMASNDTIIEMATDYSTSLLSLARKAIVSGHYELSCMYYGTWIEHTLNRLIHDLILKQKGTEQDVGIVLRDSGIRGKLVWLHLCLAGRTPPQSQLNKLTSISERRNQFVHYKWGARNIDTNDDHYSRAACEGDAFVKFIQNFERKYFFNGRKRIVRHIVNHANVKS